MRLQVLQVDTGEERRELRVGQDAGVEVVDRDADGRAAADGVVDAHEQISFR
jgi:hypothetical protein